LFLSLKESKTKVCDIAKGQEPNYLDEGCKSYWYCEDHRGTMYECPTGFQFHWEKLDCERDVDVICEKQMEYYYEHIYYRQASPHFFSMFTFKFTFYLNAPG
jgi:hypothetical protein